MFTEQDLATRAAPAGDDAIRAVFEKWAHDCRMAATMPGKNHLDETPEFVAFQEAVLRTNEIRESAADFSASGTEGLALKAYLFLYRDYGGAPRPFDPCALMTACADDDLLVSVARDLALFAPEQLVPLVAPIIDAAKPGGSPAFSVEIEAMRLFRGLPDHQKAGILRLLMKLAEEDRSQKRSAGTSADELGTVEPDTEINRTIRREG
jgi:hypothetical protein